MAGGLSVGGIVLVSTGALLLYSGLSGKGPQQVLRDVLAGKNPGPLPKPAAAAAGGGGGSGSAGGSKGEYQAYAKTQFAAYGWSEAEMAPLITLWDKESGWKPTAQNKTSTAHGIAQFLDSTWATVGATKTDDPKAQIDAGLKYIHQRYGTPTRALAFHRANNSY